LSAASRSGGGGSGLASALAAQLEKLGKKGGGEGGRSVFIISGDGSSGSKEVVQRLDRPTPNIETVDSSHAIRQRTVQSLRLLAHQEQITVEQKNVLLGDLIDSAHEEEVSMVESAYELLVGDTPAYLGEFVEQCQIIADQIIKHS
jgi:hypothetical protein